MCGIAGILEFASRPRPSRAVLDAMSEAIAHRGPDERGMWIDDGVALASRRLRVVDLVTGQQPLTNEDGMLRLVANGEIYNADELRDDLRSRGHVFTSRTDIEVILHAYEDDGPSCLDRLEGMFAFALWDGRRKRLLIARDRFGEKPLYYARLPGSFLFASELKALLVHPDVSRDLDWVALARYLTHEYVPSPHAIFRAARKLPPAHWTVIGGDGTETTTRYWSPPEPSGLAPAREDAADEVIALLRRSVRQRIVCDVPWGTFLSGGLDSSLVTALAAADGTRPVKTFAIGFEESTYDEREHAASVARLVGTEHHELVLRANDAATLLPEAARIFDEPFADPTVLPAVMLSRLARRHVTVVLSGDGGDELFCGYPTQTAHLAAELYRRLPTFLQRTVARAADRLPTSHRYLSFDFTVRRFLRDAARPAAERHLRWMGGFAPETLARLVSPGVQAEIRAVDPWAEVYDQLASVRTRSASDVATALDLILYLAEDNLVQNDRASMSTALEVRNPFLDRRLAEYALGLPASARRGIWQTKPLLRRAARDVLPGPVRRRRKHGFGVPTGAWIARDLKVLVGDMLAPERLRRQGIFDASYVAGLWTRHTQGLANHRKELWTLFMFQLWAAAYCGA
jgi:asparagine synthase (glutamine-hydrolysing)